MLDLLIGDLCNFLFACSVFTNVYIYIYIDFAPRERKPAQNPYPSRVVVGTQVLVYACLRRQDYISKQPSTHIPLHPLLRKYLKLLTHDDVYIYI